MWMTGSALADEFRVAQVVVCPALRVKVTSNTGAADKSKALPPVLGLLWSIIFLASAGAGHQMQSRENRHANTAVRLIIVRLFACGLRTSSADVRVLMF